MMIHDMDEFMDDEINEIGGRDESLAIFPVVIFLGAVVIVVGMLAFLAVFLQ